MPRFYLRHFSFDDGDRLHFIHANELRAIQQIGLKGQCYEDYFYSKDPKIENALQEIEATTAAVFQSVIAHRRLPAAGTAEDFVLRTFVCLQWGRTRSHAEASEALFDKMLKTTYGPQWRAQGITQEQLDEVYFGTEHPGVFSLGMAAETVPFVGDLESKLVLTGGLGEFVTSDTPIVLYNPFLLGRFPGSVTGLNLRGLVILFPLTPQFLAVFYDRTCYRVGSPHTQVVELTSPTDLSAINNFQFLHADDAVYYQDESRTAAHLRAFGKVAGLRRDDRNMVFEAPSTQKGDNSSLLVSYRADIPYRPPLSFLSLLRKRRGESGPVTQLEERNPEIAALFERYRREVASGVARQGFLDYYVAHRLATCGASGGSGAASA